MDYSLSCADEEFESVYRRNVDTLYRLCRLYLKCQADVDDAVQTVFLKFFENGKDFDNHSYEKAWLIKVAKNHCKDMLKSAWRTRVSTFDVLPDFPYQDNDANTEVFVALQSLPPKYKDVLYLYYYEGYSVKEISRILGRLESTIQTQLAKGRALLKLDLGGSFLEK